MELVTSTVELPRQMQGFLAHPARVRDPLPAVLVLQEIWGVDSHIQDVAMRFAAAGYVALAPDLFSTGGGRPAELAATRVEAAKRFFDTLPPQVWATLRNPQQREEELKRLPQPERQSVGETLGNLLSPERLSHMADYLKDVARSAEWLRARPLCAGRLLGAVGFCLGGGLALQLAAGDSALGAAVCFYGTPPADEDLSRIRCPVLGLYGQDDTRLMVLLPAFELAMKTHGKQLELHVYPKTPHAFFNDTRVSYRVEASRDAWARTLGLLARALSPFG